MGVHSPLVRTLPFIDQMAIYNSVNFNSYTIDTTLVNSAIAVFVCPSDAAPLPARGMTNYAVNGGVAGLVNAPFSWSPQQPFIGFQQVTDGLSATALASEWLTGVSPNTRDATRSVFGTPSPLLKVSEFETFVENCRALDPATATLNGTIKGHGWANPGFGLTMYNHAITPNGRTCTNGTLTLQGAWTASSSHGGQVTTVFADGHVKTLRATIHRNAWRAIGTMNGGEVVDDD
jgi:prepilin-type processing-associated H-X9-DG protein